MTKRTVICFTVFCIVLSMLFSLAACSTGKNNASNNTTNNEKTAETDPPKTKNNGKTLKPAETVAPSQLAETTAPSQSAETPAPIHTGETESFIYDTADILREEEYERLNDTAKGVSLRDGCGIYIAIFQNTDEYNYGSIDRFAKEVYDQWELGIDDDRCGILLVLSLAQLKYDLYLQGELATNVFGSSYSRNMLLDDAGLYFYNHDWTGGIDSFIGLCAMSLSFASDAQMIDYQSYSHDYSVINVSGVLSDAEQQQLNKMAQEVSDRTGCGIYVAPFDSMEYYGFYDIEDFAEWVFEEWDLGIGENRTCILLVMSMAGRDYDLCAHGDLAHTTFTDYGKKELAEVFLDNFRNDDWIGGFRDYIRKCDEMLEQAGASVLNQPVNAFSYFSMMILHKLQFIIMFIAL